MKNLINFFRSRPYFNLSVLFILILTIFSVYEFYWIGPYKLAGNDSYTHFAKSALILSDGFEAAKTPEIVPFTLWGKLNADNNIVYNTLTTPLTYADPLISAKLYIVITAAISACVFYLITAKTSKRPQLSLVIVTAAMLGNLAFFLKYTEMRPLVFSILFFFLTLYLLFVYKKKAFLLAVVSFAYTMLHTSALLLFIPAGILLVIDYKNVKINLARIGYIALGIILAVLLYPSDNFANILVLQFVIPLIYRTADFAIDGAYEAKGDLFTPHFLIIYNGVNVLILTAGIALYVLKGYWRQSTPSQKSSAALFVLVFGLDLLSRRFSDYITPASLIFVAMHMEQLRSMILEVFNKIRAHKVLQLATIFCAIVVLAASSFVFYKKFLENDLENVNYQGDTVSLEPEAFGAARFVANNFPQHSYLYNTAWEDFPYMLYIAPNYKYAAGMEVGFMYMYDPEMLRFYQDFRALRGFDNNGSDLIYEREDVSFKHIIQEKFKSNVIMAKKGNREKLTKLLLEKYTDLGLTKSYEDDFYAVFTFANAV